LTWGRDEPGASGSSQRAPAARHVQGRPVSAASRPVQLDSRLDARVEAADLARELRTHAQGDVLFDAASRGRYATDASIYQIDPVGVFVPAREEDALTALQIAAQRKVPVLARGGGTSQCGQTVGAALVIDCSKHLRNLTALDLDARRGRGGARHGARPPQRAAEAPRPVVPGRCLHQRAGHAGRHGRQQLLRQPLDRLRQHGAQRHRHRGLAGRRQRWPASGRWRRRAAARANSAPPSCAASPRATATRSTACGRP
jgi:hypothetical protein